MSGIHSGPQILIKQQSLYAECVHCVCHQLNFALNDAAECCAKIKSFFETTVEIYRYFFCFSAPNWAILKAFGTDEKYLTLKHVSSTR